MVMVEPYGHDNYDDGGGCSVYCMCDCLYVGGIEPRDIVTWYRGEEHMGR